MAIYEQLLDRDPRWALREGSRHFEKESAVHKGLETVARRLDELQVPYAIAGGMALFFAPVANVVLSSVRRAEEGKASGANNAIRELGGVFGVAVLATLFTSYGSYASPQAFVDGLVPALWVGAGIVALGAVAALFIPRKRREAEAAALEPELALEQAA